MRDLIFNTSTARRGVFAKRTRESFAFLALIALVSVAMFWASGHLFG